MPTKITKAIIPVAGWGTRRLPITKIIEKSMLPVGNRPLVDYSVQELIKAGVTDIYMVISNVEPCQVRAFYKDNIALNQYLESRGKTDRLALAKTLPDNVKIHYISQDPAGKYGMITTKDNKLATIIEKPKLEDVTSNLVHVSKFIMSPSLIQEMVKYVHEHDFGPKDQEYMATDPLATFVKNGGTVRVAPTSGEYLDGGSLEGWVHANDVVCGGN